MTTASLRSVYDLQDTRYGLPQVVRAETAKFTTLRSSLWTLAITVAGMGLVTFVATNGALHHDPGWYQGFDPTNQSLAANLVAALTMGVFGVLIVTGEYASGTIRTSLSATPRRWLFFAGKTLVGGGVMIAVGELLSFGCFFFGQAVLSGGGAPSASLGQPGVAQAVIMSGAFLGLLGLMGTGLGFMIRNTAGAISAYVGITFLLPLLLHQVSEHLQHYAPGQILITSVSATVRDPAQLSPTIGFLLMIAYAAAALVAGSVLFVARDT